MSEAPVPRATLYLSVGLIAGAVIALQICVMRIYSVGSWAHFGSLIVSLAMLAFGLASTIMCLGESFVERRWRLVSDTAMILFGPLMIAANLLAQQIPFNAIFLLSDSLQKWKLLGNFVLYLLPFLAGAVFLGTIFLQFNRIFGRVYFSDLTGSGFGGLAVLAAMYWIAPDNLIIVPLALWAAAGLLWFLGRGGALWRTLFVAVAAASCLMHVVAPAALGIPRLAVSDYKAVSYARKFPDNARVYVSASPFGFLEVYSSSYLHFAPGLSDNAAFALPNMPTNSYLGLYIDSDGPSGIIKDLPANQTAYFRYLPMYYPYLIKKAPQTFIVQFGGGLSTNVALRSGAKSVTVAESNPAVLDAFHDKALADFTGDVLSRTEVIADDGRLYLSGTDRKFDIVDLSLADSTGLSAAGGFSIVEKFSYTAESMRSYMRALRNDGVLSVTLWNKEEPPKSVLKLYATMAASARALDGTDISNRFFVFTGYLGTATVLFKRDGFSPDEIATLRKQTHAMSFDEIYYPGIPVDDTQNERLYSDYRDQIFSAPGNAVIDTAQAATATPQSDAEPALSAPAEAEGKSDVLPSVLLERLAWRELLTGEWERFAERYVFDVRPLSNNRPYFAAYVKTADLPHVLDRLEALQDEWGYLLLWATLGVATLTAMSLIVVPVVFGWRTIFRRAPGKLGTVVYFACLGVGYIMTEVGLIPHFILALSNAAVSASILITGMLAFSGLGSLVSERYLDRARSIMPFIFGIIAALLISYGLFIDQALIAIGALPYGLRLVLCFLLVGPPAFFMGFPMSMAMGWLGRLGKKHMFLWAWGANGCFSVIGAAAAPILATSFGTSAVLVLSGVAYIIAAAAFFAVLSPFDAPRDAEAAT